MTKALVRPRDSHEPQCVHSISRLCAPTALRWPKTGPNASVAEVAPSPAIAREASDCSDLHRVGAVDQRVAGLDLLVMGIAYERYRASEKSGAAHVQGDRPALVRYRVRLHQSGQCPHVPIS